MEEALTVEDVRAWERDLVTLEFFSYLKQAIEDCDSGVHIHLNNDRPNEAALDNAVMIKLKELYDIPGEIINEIPKEEEGG